MSNLRCDICRKTFTSMLQLNQHSKVHVKFEYIVKTKPFCPKDYMIDRNLLYENDKHLLCELCGKSYMRYNAFMKHKLGHNNDQDILNRTCRICNKIFSNVYNYQVHSAIHEGSDKYKCGVCSRTFALEYYLRRHMRTHQERRLFYCETCGKGYASKASLKDHMFVHEGSGSKPHKCYMCDKTFLRRNTLVTHINMHKRRPPESHKCSKCGKGFMFKSYLDRHLKIHSAATERPKAVDETDQRVVIFFDENGHEVDEKLYLIDESFDYFDEDSSDSEKKPDLFTVEEQVVVKAEEESVDIKPFEFS